MSDKTEWPDGLNGNQSYTLDDVLRVQKEAAQLQGELMAKHWNLLTRGVWRTVKAIALAPIWFFDALLRARIGLNTYDDLNGLDDQALAALGLVRGDINRYVLAAMDSAGAPIAGVRQDRFYGIPGGRRPADLPRIETPRRRAA